MKSFLLLLFLLPLSASAQWYYGGKISGTFSNFRSSTRWEEAPKIGGAIGVVAFKQVKPTTGFSVEALYVQKGYYHKICNAIFDKMQANYLEVPISFDYSIRFPRSEKIFFHVNAGAYAAYWLSAKYTMDGFDETTEEYNFEKRGASRFDFGPNAGASVEYFSGGSRLALQFRYELGLADMERTATGLNANRCAMLALVYTRTKR